MFSWHPAPTNDSFNHLTNMRAACAWPFAAPRLTPISLILGGRSASLMFLRPLLFASAVTSLVSFWSIHISMLNLYVEFNPVLLNW